MTFYLKLPLHTINVYDMMKDNEARLNYLYELHQRWGDKEKVDRIFHENFHLTYCCNSLIEDSEKDLTNHLFLKLASFPEKKLQHFITEAETIFFEHRLMTGGNRMIKTTILETLADIERGNLLMDSDQKEFIYKLEKILRNLVDTGMYNCTAREPCQHFIAVPWELVESLVQMRIVLLQDGIAQVQCNQIIELLRLLFKTNYVLGFGIIEEIQKVFYTDPRCAELIDLARSHLKRSIVGTLTKNPRMSLHANVEKEMKYFPQCMVQLHKKLKSQNRLHHYERIRYTVFLKDVGMPLEENIAFWQKFYSRPFSSDGGCSHMWKEKVKSYIYNIRHMYGLEGHRKDLKSYSCSRLQEQGGCPFSSHDPADVLPALMPLVASNTTIQDTISKEMKAGRPTAACKAFMKFTSCKMTRDFNAILCSNMQGGPSGGGGCRSDDNEDIEDLAKYKSLCIYTSPVEYYLNFVKYSNSQTQ